MLATSDLSATTPEGTPMRSGLAITLLSIVFALDHNALGQPEKKQPAAAATFPPKLPDGKDVLSATSEDFLKPPATLRQRCRRREDRADDRLPVLPRPDYAGKPWSNWGDSLAGGGKYYASIGDHLAVGGKGDAAHTGTGLVFEYDPDEEDLPPTRRRGEAPRPARRTTTFRARSTAGSTWAATAGSTSRRTAVPPPSPRTRTTTKGDWIVALRPEDRQERGRRSRAGAEALHSHQRARPGPADLLRRHRAGHRREGPRHPVLRLRREEQEAAVLRSGRAGAVHDLREVHRPDLLRARARRTWSVSWCGTTPRRAARR